MATCPRCLGALTENHKCPRGAWRRITDRIPAIVIGVVVAVLFVYALDERPTAALVLTAAILGAVLASALRQSVKF
jgi:uncharacterized membrane protein YgaE (UPF0421/DUF939 family)